MSVRSECTNVVVIGGGPGGATFAALTAARGVSVTLFEKEEVPRFHIGESLITETYWTFERLGILEKLEASDFPRKHSVQFISEDGRPSRPFYFSDRDPRPNSVTWQVDRAEFDEMLLDNAREKGVDVRTGVSVSEVIFEGDRAIGVRGVGADGEPFEMHAQVVVDASGLNSVLARQLRILRRDPHLVKAAVYGHFENARRDEGIDEGATLIIHTKENRGWFWYIPLSRNRVSIGVVGAAKELLAGKGTPDEVFRSEIEACPSVAERVAEATLLPPVRVTSDFTYRATKCSGDGWVLIGDAFGFMDPIYSSGVLLALKSGELASDAVVDALAAKDVSGARLGTFGEQIASGLEAFRKTVYAFYTPGFSFANFVQQHPEHRDTLIRILIGDVFKDDTEEIFTAMGTMCDLPEPLESDV